MNNEKPAINIYVAPNQDEKVIKEICLGIEEEGIPYEIKEKTNKNHKELAYEAAINSKLSIGIGINEKIALNHEKLPKDQSIFEITSNGKLKTLGTNGAKLVKGSPLVL